MIDGRSPDITQLSYGLTKRLVYGTSSNIDLVTSADTQVHDVLAGAESCAYDFDLKQVWLTRSRWNTLVRQYVDPDALAAWLDMIETKLTGRKRGLSFMRTNSVAERQSEGRIGNRRWGSCMLGVGYRAMPRPQLTLHSRTTYIGYIGQLDLALAHVLAREVAVRVGLDVEDIAFAWHLEAGQFHGFKSLAWFWQHERDAANLGRAIASDTVRRKYPTLRLAAKQMQGFMMQDEAGVLYGDMSFSQQLRIRRRLHTELHGPDYGRQFEGRTTGKLSMTTRAPVLPSAHVSTLDLSALAGPTDAPSDGAGMIEEDDE